MENSKAPKLPTQVSVLGWGWTIVGILSFLSGGMALLMLTVMNAMVPGGFPPHIPANGKFPPQFAVMEVVFAHFGVLATVQVVLAACVIYTGTRFLKLHEWARCVLLVLSVLVLTYVVSFSIFWMYMWSGMTSAAAAKPGGPPMFFSVFGIVAGSLNMVMFSVPPILSIIALRGKVVREAIANRSMYIQDD